MSDNSIGNNGLGISELLKIDTVVPNALLGTEGSLSYLVAKLNGHFHNYERWLVKAAVPNAEIHVADTLLIGSTPFQINAGNDTWGAWIQIAGSSDTPVQPGKTKFDIHEILITAYQRNSTIYKIQIASGTSGSVALSNGTYTEFPIITATGTSRPDPAQIMNLGQSAGTKVWARCWAIGAVSGTIDFLIGLHEYIG